MRKLDILCLSAAIPCQAQLAPSAQSKGDADKGNEVFDEQCSSCHNAYSTNAKPAQGSIFP